MNHSRIITKYLSEIHNGEGDLRVDFDKTGKESVHLDMEVVGAAPTDIFWEIYSNGQQLDNNDPTKGKKAELIILKTYAGPPEHPHEFSIITRDAQGHTIAQLKILVFAFPKITDAFWVGEDEKKIYEASINKSFSAYFKGYGLFNTPLAIRFYFKSDDGNDIEISDFARAVIITTPYDLTDFYIDRETLKENYKFFLRNSPKILMDYFTNQQIAVTGQIKNTAIAKAYFTISHHDEILFHGKRENELINLIFDLHAIVPSQPVKSISPVFIANEEYFTQKYEPCKYEKIFYRFGDSNEVPIFDEKKPVKKDADGNFTNSKIEISAIVPPRGSKNTKELKIRLENVKTDDCSLLDENKKHTNILPGSEPEYEKPHKGRVIDTKELDNAHIECVFETVDEKITIKPTFDYLYDEKSPWEFLKNYFLFSATLSNINPLENSFKGVLMDSEIEWKGLVQRYRIPLETCRYRKNLWLTTYPDVAWAFHLFYDEPSVKRYYIEDEDIAIRKGLEKQIQWLQENNTTVNVLAPIDILGLQDSINDFVLELLKDMADKYELGFSAYYDFNQAGKCGRRIEYAKEYPSLFDTLIGSAVTLEVLIQVLLAIITEGTTARLALAKLTSTGVRLPAKLARIGKDALININRTSREYKLVGKIQKVNTFLKMAAFTYYKGYRFVEAEEIGIQPLLEERMSFSPLCEIEHEHKQSIGKLVLDASPVGKIINLTQDLLNGLNLAVNKLIFKKKDDTELVEHYVKFIDKGLDNIHDYLSFLTDRIVEKVFGVKAEYSISVSGEFGMDFELKVHNAVKKLDVTNFIGKGSSSDASSATLAPSAGLFVKMKVDASVKMSVRALNIINYANICPFEFEKMEGEGKLEVNSGIYWERRWFYNANEKQFYAQDSAVFTGIAGEYEYERKVKIKPSQKQKDESENIDFNQEPKKFVLIPPQILTHKPAPVINNPIK